MLSVIRRIEDRWAFVAVRTVRVVWISFRLSEPETRVRILHGPPLSLPATDFVAIHVDD